MSTVVLCCNTLENELKLVLEESGLNYPVAWLEAGLHNQPDKLRAHIDDSLKALGFGCCAPRRALLALGYCGGAVNRLGPFDFEMIMPRADDCLSLLMGSMALRHKASASCATYFLTEGWLRHTENLITSFSHDQNVFGRERAERIYKIMLKYYRRFGFIDTGSYDLNGAMESTRPLADLIGIENEILPGNLNWLQNLLTGPWDDKDFIVIKAGKTLSDDDWGWLAGTALQNI